MKHVKTRTEKVILTYKGCKTLYTRAREVREQVEHKVHEVREQRS